MKSISIPFLISLILLSLQAGEARSQEALCSQDDSLVSCEKKVLASISADAFATPVAEVSDALAERIRDMVPPEVALTTVGERPDTNFLDRWGISVENKGLENDEQALAISHLLFGDSGKIEVLVRNAEVYDKILAEIPEDSRESRGKELNKKLSDLDNLLVSFSWRLNTAVVGRDQGSNQDLLGGLWAEAVTRVAAGVDRQASEALNRAALDFGECIRRSGQEAAPDFDSKTLGQLFGNEFNDCGKKAEQHYRLGGQRALLNQTFFKEVASSYSSLVLGQPELVITGAASSRDRLLGPEEQKAKISYDFGNFGGRSLNNLRQHCKCEATLDCYNRYLDSTKDDKEHPGTFSVSLTWSRNPHWDISLPEDDIELDIGTEEKIVATLAFDRPIVKQNDDDSTTVIAKFVVNGSYEQWLSDSDKNDRGLLEATYIHRVSDGVSASLGLVWANHPEFVEDQDFDHEFSAKAGFNFRIGKTD